MARHHFRINIPMDKLQWNDLGNYTPFETSDKGDEVLFSINYVETLPQVNPVTLAEFPAEEDMIALKLSESGSDWLFEFKLSGTADIPMGALLVSGDLSQGWFCPNASLRRSNKVYMFNYSVMLLFSFASCRHNTLAIHASVVRNGSKSYLFLGKSGTGKSTHSRLWLDNIPGTDLINDDNPIIGVLEDGTVMAYGSPWSGKTPCYRNTSAAVGAFVKIRQSKENVITPLSVVEAYAALYSSTSGYKLDERFADPIHKSMEMVAVNVPFYCLDCRPDKEAAEICHKEICR